MGRTGNKINDLEEKVKTLEARLSRLVESSQHELNKVALRTEEAHTRFTLLRGVLEDHIRTKNGTIFLHGDDT